MYVRKLVGSKCFLSPMEIEDARKYISWLNDLDVTQFTMLAQQSISYENEKETLGTLGKQHNYGIVDIETDELIGSCGLMDIDHLNQTAEVGIIIGKKEYWSKGYGTEALGLLADYAFNYLNIHNLMLRVYSFNDRGIHCYEKLGFKRIGLRRSSIKRHQKSYDTLYMDLIAEDFYALWDPMFNNETSS